MYQHSTLSGHNAGKNTNEDRQFIIHEQHEDNHAILQAVELIKRECT